jgi:predicted alpha/beta-hydrolase family hydrolase
MAEESIAFVDETAAPAVRGMLHPAGGGAGRDALVLTHGAGSNRDAPLLVLMAAALATRGLTVLRCDLPFRQARAQGPPGAAGAARDRAGLQRAVGVMRALVPGRVFLGGHSYGGRQSSMLTAEQPWLAAGLLLLSYPLHPPRRPEAARTAHFERLRVPALFVHGSRDPFGSLATLREALRLIPGPTTLVPVEGAGHGLLPRGGDGAGLARVVVSAFLALVAGVERA